MDAMTKSKYITIQQASIHYLEAGETVSPTVLFLHGANFSAQTWEDLGTLALDQYCEEMAAIYAGLLPLLRPKGHCVINVPDMWWENQRITIHMALTEALRSVGYELRNTIIWDRTNIVNKIGIFGWPSNYITMGTTFEYLLDFWRPN